MFLNAIDYVNKNGSSEGITSDDISRGTKLIKHEDVLSVDELNDAFRTMLEQIYEDEIFAIKNGLTDEERLMMMRENTFKNVVEFNKMLEENKNGDFISGLIGLMVNDISKMLENLDKEYSYN